MGGATPDVDEREDRLPISIHAPHARSDPRDSVICRTGSLISIHAPHARSDTSVASAIAAVEFQSTLLMRGATAQMDARITEIKFQSTLLMRGATIKRRMPFQALQFQSTLLMRGATTGNDDKGSLT